MVSPFFPRFSFRQDDPQPWEPALSQLRRLPTADLDQLVLNWLRHSGLQPSRRIDREHGATTYRAILGRFPFHVQLAVRIHQRDSGLQPHHVEAFLGYLARQGLPAGLLVTTGGCSTAAFAVGAGSAVPRVRTLSGAQWLQELTTAGVGLSERYVPRWMVDLQRLRRRFRTDSTD